MIYPPELRAWLDSLRPGSAVAVADDGLTVVEIDSHGHETGAHVEVGGPPRPELDQR